MLDTASRTNGHGPGDKKKNKKKKKKNNKELEESGSVDQLSETADDHLEQYAIGDHLLADPEDHNTKSTGVTKSQNLDLTSENKSKVEPTSFDQGGEKSSKSGAVIDNKGLKLTTAATNTTNNNDGTQSSIAANGYLGTDLTSINFGGALTGNTINTQDGVKTQNPVSTSASGSYNMLTGQGSGSIKTMSTQKVTGKDGKTETVSNGGGVVFSGDKAGANVTINNIGVTVVANANEIQGTVSGKKGSITGFYKNDGKSESYGGGAGNKYVSASVAAGNHHDQEQGDQTVQGKTASVVTSTDGTWQEYAGSATFKKVVTLGISGGASEDNIHKYGRLIPADANTWTSSQWTAWDKAVADDADLLQQELGKDVWKLQTGQVFGNSKVDRSHWGGSLQVLFMKVSGDQGTSTISDQSMVVNEKTIDIVDTKGSGSDRTEDVKLGVFIQEKKTFAIKQLESIGFSVLRETPEAMAALQRYLDTGLLPGTLALTKEYSESMHEKVQLKVKTYTDLKDKLRDGESTGIGTFAMAKIITDFDALVVQINALAGTVLVPGSEPVPGILYTSKGKTTIHQKTVSQGGWLVEEKSSSVNQANTTTDRINTEGQAVTDYGYQRDDDFSNKASDDVSAFATTDANAATAFSFSARAPLDYAQGQGIQQAIPEWAQGTKAYKGYTHMEMNVSLSSSDLEGIGACLDKDSRVWPGLASSAATFWTQRQSAENSYASKLKAWEKEKKDYDNLPILDQNSTPLPSSKPMSGAVLNFYRKLNPPSVEQIKGSKNSKYVQLNGYFKGVSSPADFLKLPDELQKTFIASATLNSGSSNANAFDAIAAVEHIEDPHRKAKMHVMLVGLAKQSFEHQVSNEASKDDIGAEWLDFQKDRSLGAGDRFASEGSEYGLTSSQLDFFRGKADSQRIAELAEYLFKPVPTDLAFGGNGGQAQQALDIFRACEETSQVELLLAKSRMSGPKLANLLVGNPGPERWVRNIVHQLPIGREIDLLIDHTTGFFFTSQADRDSAWATKASMDQKATATSKEFYELEPMALIARVEQLRKDEGIMLLSESLKAAGFEGSRLLERLWRYPKLVERLLLDSALGGTYLAGQMKKAIGEVFGRKLRAAIANDDIWLLGYSLGQAQEFQGVEAALTQAKVTGLELRGIVERGSSTTMAARLAFKTIRLFLVGTEQNKSYGYGNTVVGNALRDAVSAADEVQAKKWVYRVNGLDLPRKTILARAKTTPQALAALGVPRKLLISWV